MAIAEDASSPAVKHVTGTGACTTAAFSPPAGSLVVAMASGGWSTTADSITVSDSSAATWTKVQAQCSATDKGVSAVAYTYFASAPGSITVSATFGNAQGRSLVVKVLTGAASSQTGAASATANKSTATTAYTLSLTTTTTGSMVYGAAQSNGVSSSTMTANANSTMIDQWQNNTDSANNFTFKSSSATGTPGATTFGGTLSASDEGSITLLEILPAATGPTNVPAADTGSLTGESATVQAVPVGSDTGSLTGESATVRVSGAADTGSLTGETATVRVIGGEIANQGADTASALANVPAADTGSLTGENGVQTSTVPGSDTGSLTAENATVRLRADDPSNQGADTAVARAFAPAADTGSLTGENAGQLQTSGDTGSLTAESANVRVSNTSDSAGGLDSAGFTAVVFAADTAQGLEGTPNIRFSDADTGSGSDTAIKGVVGAVPGGRTLIVDADPRLKSILADEDDNRTYTADLDPEVEK